VFHDVCDAVVVLLKFFEYKPHKLIIPTMKSSEYGEDEGVFT
jgi:hypothetical protein